MFKEFKLKKKSWHMWVMKFIWNLESRDFSHMCPYFWLSVFNVFVAFIPVLLAKGVLWCIQKAVASVRKMNKASRDVKRLNTQSTYETRRKEALAYLESIAKDDTKLEAFAKQLASSFWGKGKVDSIVKWLNGRVYLAHVFGEETFKKYQVYIDKYEEIYQLIRFEEEERKRNNTIANKQRINNILKYARPVAQGVIFIAALGTLVLAFYWSFLGINSLLGLSSETWGDVRWWLGFMILCLAALIAFIYTIGFIVILFRSINVNFDSPFWTKIEDLLYRYIVCPIDWFFTGVGTIGSIVIQMFKNNCPPIKWD